MHTILMYSKTISELLMQNLNGIQMYRTLSIEYYLTSTYITMIEKKCSSSLKPFGCIGLG